MIVESHAAGSVYGLPVAALPVWVKLTAQAALASIPGEAFPAFKIKSLEILTGGKYVYFWEKYRNFRAAAS